VGGSEADLPCIADGCDQAKVAEFEALLEEGVGHINSGMFLSDVVI
jgi:hypothetical protein